MTRPRAERLAGSLRLLQLSARSLGGRRFWIWPLVTLAWPVMQVSFLLLGWIEQEFGPASAQNSIIGTPLVVLGLMFGVQIIAGEIDRRTLEIAYTVPGGTYRVWLYKLGAALLLLVVAEALLAAATFVFLTEFPLGALYGALQGAVFYMVLAMGLSALAKSEAAGALLAAVVLAVNMVLLQPAQLRLSPLWNPEGIVSADPADLLAWTVQNRIGFALAIAAIVALAFGRAEQREKLLGG